MPDRTEAVPVSTTPDPSARKTVVAVVLTLAALELVRTAWIGDDAAITLRSVLNVMHGYGATFNIDERVQTYTHPLWFLLIAATTEVTRNVFASTFALSFALSLAVIALLMARIAGRFEAGVLAACVLLVSKAYVDFAASGLEHPLCNLILLLVILFAMRATARTDGGAARWFFLSCSLLYLSRPDEALVAAPLALLVVSRYRREPGTLLSALSIGALPAIAWTIFSLTAATRSPLSASSNGATARESSISPRASM